MKMNRNTKIKANTDSKTVSNKIFLPDSLSFWADNEPPIENVINDSEMDNNGSVCSTNRGDITPNKSGFSIIPAKMYPEIFGNFIFSASSPKTYPVNIKIPMLKITFITNRSIYTVLS